MCDSDSQRSDYDREQTRSRRLRELEEENARLRAEREEVPRPVHGRRPWDRE